MAFFAVDEVECRAYADRLVAYVRDRSQPFPGDPPASYEIFRQRHAYAPHPDNFPDIFRDHHTRNSPARGVNGPQASPAPLSTADLRGVMDATRSALMDGISIGREMLAAKRVVRVRPDTPYSAARPSYDRRRFRTTPHPVKATRGSTRKQQRQEWRNKHKDKKGKKTNKANRAPATEANDAAGPDNELSSTIAAFGGLDVASGSSSATVPAPGDMDDLLDFLSDNGGAAGDADVSGNGDADMHDVD
ncbi:hypothetical protein EV714DRAFT_278258 [Schizophyllum commune]